jgi:hypothetical protein
MCAGLGLNATFSRSTQRQYGAGAGLPAPHCTNGTLSLSSSTGTRARRARVRSSVRCLHDPVGPHGVASISQGLSGVGEASRKRRGPMAFARQGDPTRKYRCRQAEARAIRELRFQRPVITLLGARWGTPPVSEANRSCSLNAASTARAPTISMMAARKMLVPPECATPMRFKIPASSAETSSNSTAATRDCEAS